MARHDGFVQAIVRQQVLGELPFEEALQTGRIGLWRAILGFDPTQGFAFSTYAWTVIKHHLTVEPLYSEALASLSVEAFMTAPSTLDAVYAARIAAAQAQGKVLRYVARVTPEGGTVGLTAVERDGPPGALRGPGNYIALHTTRYRP